MFRGDGISWRAKVLLLALAATVPACNGPRYQKQQSAGEGEPIPTAVRVAAPVPAEDVELGAPLSGVVRAAGQVQIGFQVPGEAEAVFVEEGDSVTVGQVLAQLDRRIYSAQAAQAAAALAQAEAALRMLEEGARPQEIAVAKAQRTSAEAVVSRARADCERAEELFREGVIPRKDLDAAQTALVQAEQALETASELLALVLEGPRDQEIAAARGARDQARAALDQASTQLDYAELKAPVSGTVVMRQLEVGQTVSTGMPVFELANLNELEVWTEIPEGRLSKIQLGDEVEIGFPAAPELRALGRVRSIAPNAQSSTRGFPVKVELVDHDENVVPGLVALVQFDYRLSPGGHMIPERAIINGSVLVVEADKAVRKPVAVLLDRGDRVFVDGLDADDRVIVNGQHYLEPGDLVAIVDALGIEGITKLEQE
ncbi:efflux RND transporter periplasmic adaptor subunit [bacterium]|nr:efflux RND transporter periplasmic adaptor subunit [bacterium]